MRNTLTVLRSRVALALGLLTLALSQAGCAHPVWVEPSVVVQARVGGPVYGAPVGAVHGGLYAPPPVVVVPAAPLWMPPPPWVMAPRMLPPRAMPHGRPGWRGEHHGHERGHGWGHRGG